MIKAIIFDIGGILDKGKPEEHWRELCSSLKIDISVFNNARKKYTGLARTGKISTRAYLSKIAVEIGVSYEKLYEAWLKTKRENMQKDREIEELIIKLKKKYKIVTITNIIELHHKVRVELGLYDLFEHKIVSFEKGIDKPNPSIYQLALEELKIKAEEIVFIDDSERNLEPARKLGMKTILFKDNQTLMENLRELGVET